MKRVFAAMALVAAISLAAAPVQARQPHHTAAVAGGMDGFSCAMAGVIAGWGVLTLDPLLAGIGTIAGAKACF